MIGSAAYIPRRGDVVWINLDPQKGASTAWTTSRCSPLNAVRNF